jgi:NTF2-related export protein 1/2
MAATTSTIDPTTEKKNLIDSACTTGKNFIDLFYDKMDTKRHNMAKSYLDTATLSWNGNRVDGNNKTFSVLN